MNDNLNKVPQALFDKLEEGREILSKLPGVLWVSYGLKEKNGVFSDEYGFLVGVQKKKEISELNEADIVPAELFGFKTDVIDNPVKQKIVLTLADLYSRKHNPLIGGIMIGNGLKNTETGAMGVGTLGVIAKKDNVDVILSAKHVIYDNGAVDGSQLGHPYVSVGCSDCCDTGVIGHALDKTNDDIDCAIASVLDTASTENTIREIGDHMGSGPVLTGATVRKIGITTGLTTGTVLQGPNSDEFYIEPTSGFMLDGVSVFAATGDSGAALIDEDDKVVGILNWVQEGNSHIGWAIRIAPVIAALGITIEPSDNGLEFMRAPKIEEPIAKTAFNKLVENYPSLESINDLFSMHKSEILHLVNNEREVKVGWHRKRGPVFFAHFLKAAKENVYAIPAEVDGVTFPSLLMHLSAMFDKYGSKELKEDLKSSAVQVMQSLITLQKESQLKTKPNNE